MSAPTSPEPVQLVPGNTLLTKTPEEGRQLATVTTAMNSLPDVIFYKDMDGVYRGGNTAWAALVGRPFAELVGKTDAEIFPAELAAAYRTDDQKTIDGGKPRQFQEWLVYPDGRKVYADTLKTPWIGENGKVLGVVGICRQMATPAGTQPDRKD